MTRALSNSLSIKPNTKYTVGSNTLRILTRDYPHLTDKSKRVELIIVKLNRSSVVVNKADVMRKGLIAALTNKRRYCKTLTVFEYELISGILHNLYQLQQTM